MSPTVYRAASSKDQDWNKSYIAHEVETKQNYHYLSLGAAAHRPPTLFLGAPAPQTPHPPKTSLACQPPAPAITQGCSRYVTGSSGPSPNDTRGPLQRPRIDPGPSPGIADLGKAPERYLRVERSGAADIRYPPPPRGPRSRGLAAPLVDTMICYVVSGRPAVIQRSVPRKRHLGYVWRASSGGAKRKRR